MRPEEMASDLRWMEEALKEAGQAGQAGEVPVGAVIVRGGEILARGRNRVEALKDPSAHAEILAIRSAAAALGYQRLSECTLYVTLEPCAMCAGAIVLARLDRLVFGAADPKTGACGSLMNIVQDGRLNHRVPVTRDVRGAECGALLKAFFGRLRGQ
jgi:tRNA(adenine34) deaminase